MSGTRIPDDLIGMQPRVQELESILNDDDVRVLGIWGMNGIGKTTQVTVLYDKISHKFNGCCFIRDVSEIYKKHIDGASVIQKQILLQTFKEENLETCDSVELSRRIKQRLHNIRVLIVLDNVDQIQQLKALAIDPKMLMKGSRMIITTTDKKILRWYSANVIHEVSLLNDNDARELFYKKAFENKDQISDYVELMIPDILKYAQRLPLAIEVMGSCLRDCNLEQWIDLLHRLENDPDDGIKNALQKCIDGLHFYDEIKNALQKCVDGLHFYEKEIFLHIACFFNGERKDYVDRILECCELYPWNGISRMVEKSLITLRDEEIYMHEMLKELGKEMVCDQHLYEPERWSRLWLYKDFSRVLTSELGADNVQAIVLNKREDITECNIEGMSRMKNLRLLILYHSTFSGSLDYLSSKLRYFSWNNYPFDSLPSNFVAIDLVELNMPNSKIKRVWEGCKNFPNMKRIELSNSKYLTESPDFSKIPKLERLDLSGCTSLSEVHPTIGLLEKLAFLSLRNCNNLVSINFDKKSNLSSLRVLHLSGCTKLKNTPDFTSATNLEYLDIDGCTSLTLIDESIGSLANLTYLSLRDCKNVVSIPHTINTMSSLQTLDLRGCLKLVNLSLGITVNASYLMPLIFLDISFCNLLELPDAILMLECLERMNLQGNNFVSIPNLFRLRRLAYLNLSHCSKLERLPQLPLDNDTPAGRYFKTVSGSRDHRSGLYLFDCPKMERLVRPCWNGSWLRYDFRFFVRLIKEPNHFRCGFDIVFPWDWLDTSLWFKDYKIFDGCAVMRITGFSEADSWLGFSFCVSFEVKNGPAVSSSSHNPFYLSFESEYTEEYFDMPLNLEVDNIDESKYFWIIYISKEHCHFVKSGAHITFKGHPHVEICGWGIRSIFEQDIDLDDFEKFSKMGKRPHSNPDDLPYLDFDYVKNSNNSFGPKIQLPYNWLVTDEDEAENINAKAKGKGLSYAGL
ncbi:disease resistance protein RPP2A isoform X2 [Cajanus cajan]|uniref:disease resistance protein RPP2A isoform X2 n=1 Tax=Cajanus cajan TaxID=3821 RepID=UPI00098DC078|nr:disease resistance protein RPP2A isoform X2 [Cajanus cajan]